MKFLADINNFVVRNKQAHESNENNCSFDLVLINNSRITKAYTKYCPFLIIIAFMKEIFEIVSYDLIISY